MINADLFKTTRSSYWGGPWYSYWMLGVVSVCFGFLGLDHLFLRSPTSAFLKLIVNIFGLGIWYFYDLIQVLGEKDSVMKNGLSVPFFGATGIGAGMFKDDQPNATPSRSPFRFIAYCLLLFFPFGFDSFIGGDTNGALMKFICTVIPIFWPILFIWGVYTFGTAYFKPKVLYEEGIPRLFPFTWFMDAKGPSKLGPKDIPFVPGEEGCDPGGFTGILRSVMNTLSTVLPPFIMTAINSVFPGVAPAVQSVAAATQAGATTVKAAANTATGVIQALKEPAIQTASLVSGMASEIPTALAQGPALAAQAGQTLQAFQNPDVLKQLAAKQMGGGGLEGSDASNTALLFVFGAILLGGAWYSLKHLNNSVGGWYRKDASDSAARTKGRERDDTPPKA